MVWKKEKDRLKHLKWITQNNFMYTERQNKLITSSGRLSLKSPASKLIIFWHKWALILLNKNIRKTQDLLASKRRKYCLITKGHFSKIAETAHQASSTETAYSWSSKAIHSISMAGYVNTVRAIVCSELPAREASNFCDFWKLTSCDLIHPI